MDDTFLIIIDGKQQYATTTAMHTIERVLFA